MKTPIIAITAAMACAGAAFAQTGAPTSTAPTTTSPTMPRGGSTMTPGLDSSKATGSTGPASPSGSTGTAKSLQPGGTSKLYIVPAHPNASSGDDGSTAGKTNRD